MRATVMYEAGDVRVEDVPDATIVEPTDALIRVTRACVCGSDLHPYHQMERSETGTRMGHEAVGVVEDVGSQVTKIEKGDLVVMPFAYSDGTCEFCREGLPTACVHVGFFGNPGTDGAQAEAVRVPYADGTLFALPVGEDDALMPSLLTLSDVMGTGHHAAVAAQVGPGKIAAVVGDGAVGLCGVIAAKRLGAEQIIIMGRHEDRIALAREFGATDVVSERARRPSSASETSPAASAPTRCWSASATSRRWRRPSASRVRAGRSGASACPRTRRSPPRCRRSSATSPSVAGPPRSGRTSRNSCRTCWRAGSSPAASSTGP